jgi:rhodanese-related sulfurtransferase
MQYEIEADELKKLLDSGDPVVLVDVREPWEHEVVHLPGSQHIPMYELGRRLDEIDRDRLHVLYCHHGVRSLHAVMALAERGFENVRSLRGGIDHWAAVIDPETPRY